jgi:hypothetical protein
VILFTQAHMLAEDWRLQSITAHPLARRFPDRIFVYDERDRPWCAFPGVYVSMPRRLFKPAEQRAWAYYRSPPMTAVAEPDLLFSLVASPTARCREPLFSLRHPDAVVERVERFTFFDPASVCFGERRDRFRLTVARSRFVLCPRGRGTSSIRLYETMAAGRVPVIIADDWVPPDGPDWDSFSIRWPEGRTHGLTETLAIRDSDWPELSRCARDAHQRFFSEQTSGKRILDLCEVLWRNGAGGRAAGRVRDRGYLEAGAGTIRWRLESSGRRQAKRLVERLVTRP